MAFELKKQYTDLRGNEYNNIHDIHFFQKEELSSALGKYICETIYEKHAFCSSSDNLVNGVYIYQTLYDLRKALRIYKNWADYKYVFHNDASLISELQNRQIFIKLTDFPTGVVTLEGHIIGQEIILYENYLTLLDISKLKEIKKIINYYLNMIEILKELYNADIIYADCHAKNFVINKQTDEVKLIDFDPSKIRLQKEKYMYSKMIECLKDNINRINEIKQINFELIKEDTLEHIEETVLEKKLKI